MQRVQFLLTDEMAANLDRLVEVTGLKTRTQLLNMALTLFEWAVREREAGNIIASVDEENDKYKEVTMPGFPAIKPIVVSERRRQTKERADGNPNSEDLKYRRSVTQRSTVGGTGLKIKTIPGDNKNQGNDEANFLETVGAKDGEALLYMGATPEGRKEIAEKSGISDSLILDWVNRVDLARVKGIGSEYADLLEASGVDTVVELATRKPENLVAKMIEINTAKKLVRKLPTLSQVKDWIEQAKKLPRVIIH
jgi:predicted flap endonuclease-1-like 5' DNA nuclease